MNIYEFKKKKSKLADHVFTHEYFQKGRQYKNSKLPFIFSFFCKIDRDLLKFIKRKNAKPTPGLPIDKSDESRKETEEDAKVLQERAGLLDEVI